MSYEPTNWQAGDIVTSAKLNKLEQGVANGGGILVVYEDENGRLDKTWREIYNAELAVIQLIDGNYKDLFLIREIGVANDTYFIECWNSTLVFSTSSPDDYPVYNKEAGGGVPK